MKQLVRHLGSHLVLSVAIVIPVPGLRSAARFAWTAAFRLKVLFDLARGKITREEYHVARSIHSIPVMLVALIPGFGAVAYVASGTMVKAGLGRMLLDQSAYKLPFGLYEKLGLARLTRPRSRKAAGDGLVLPMPGNAPAGPVGFQDGGPIWARPQPAHASFAAFEYPDVLRQTGTLKQLATPSCAGKTGLVAVPLDPAA